MRMWCYLTIRASGPSAQIAQIRKLIDEHTEKPRDTEITDFEQMCPGVPNIECGLRSRSTERSKDPDVIWTGEIAIWPASFLIPLSNRFPSTTFTMEFYYLGDADPDDSEEEHKIEFTAGREKVLYERRGGYEFDGMTDKLDHWRVSLVFDEDGQEDEVMGVLVQEDIFDTYGSAYTTKKTRDEGLALIRSRFPDVRFFVDYWRPYHSVEFDWDPICETKPKKSDELLATKKYRFKERIAVDQSEANRKDI